MKMSAVLEPTILIGFQIKWKWKFVALAFILALFSVQLLNLRVKMRHWSHRIRISRPSRVSDSSVDINLQHCPCVRRMNSSLSSSPGVHYNATTCSQDAFQRGSGQKVVAFSFYGDVDADYSKKKGYFEGIRGNLKLMDRFYPGWVMRVYFDLDPKDPTRHELCQLACQNPILDLCHAGQLPGTPMSDARKMFPMNWRFLPTLDPQVEVFVCRDLDSRFSERELAAVDEWLQSDQAVHVMRDHPSHGIAILGASWGSYMTRRNARKRWQDSWTKIIEDPKAWADRKQKGPDQQILQKYVWPWAKRACFQHDSYHCRVFSGSRPFPTQRKAGPNNFVASVVTQNESLTRKCPLECRPNNHQDWEHC